MKYKIDIIQDTPVPESEYREFVELIAMTNLAITQQPTYIQVFTDNGDMTANRKIKSIIPEGWTIVLDTE